MKSSPLKPKDKIAVEHKCALCPYSTRIFGNYNLHLRAHSSEKPFKCPDCPFRAKRNGHIKQHSENVHLFQSPSSRPFPCPHSGCNYRAKNKPNLKRHSKHHKEEKSCFCLHPNCNYSTNENANFIVHGRVHTGEKPYACEFESCSYSSANLGNLQSHARTHTKEKPFKCPQPNCEYAAAANDTVKQHQLTHAPKEGEEPLSFSCPLCEYSGKSKRHLIAHIKSHTLEKCYKCEAPNCNYQAKTKSKVDRHKASKHSDEKPFACSFESCEFRCKTKCDLSKHLKTHSEEWRYKCELCPFRAKTRAVVTNHLKNIHSDPNFRPFKCPDAKCDYATKSKGSLKTHLLMHKGDKKYACSFPGCAFKAITNVLVRQHQKSHEKENRFKCELCEFGCRAKITLVRHMRKHTN